MRTSAEREALAEAITHALQGLDGTKLVRHQRSIVRPVRRMLVPLTRWFAFRGPVLELDYRSASNRRTATAFFSEAELAALEPGFRHLTADGTRRLVAEWPAPPAAEARAAVEFRKDGNRCYCVTLVRVERRTDGVWRRLHPPVVPARVPTPHPMAALPTPEIPDATAPREPVTMLAAVAMPPLVSTPASVPATTAAEPPASSQVAAAPPAVEGSYRRTLLQRHQCVRADGATLVHLRFKLTALAVVDTCSYQLAGNDIPEGGSPPNVQLRIGALPPHTAATLRVSQRGPRSAVVRVVFDPPLSPQQRADFTLVFRARLHPLSLEELHRRRDAGTYYLAEDVVAACQVGVTVPTDHFSFLTVFPPGYAIAGLSARAGSTLPDVPNPTETRRIRDAEALSTARWHGRPCLRLRVQHPLLHHRYYAFFAPPAIWPTPDGPSAVRSGGSTRPGGTSE